MNYGNEWNGFLLLISIINTQEAFEWYVAIRGWGFSPTLLF